ncbi:hypothetical protein JK635_03555 [Neobacillus sp. YIM B02564]|uniref:Uncharacterized protein n=1 Tax=Neobacillus paridis TaxID=2803862 RepID=A0ABS1TJ64_9BACI|nr:hypothetical protein [Neobacillus paridis]MBL4951317.1 hypothetical protein [Neobacillus paridis]
MAKNEYLNGRPNVGKVEIQPAIIEFMRQKGEGVEVSHEEISDFIYNKFGIRFGEINHVMWGLRRDDSRVVKGKRGYSKLVE